MMNRKLLLGTLNSVKDWDVFNITEKFRKMRLSDDNASSSSNETVSRTTISKLQSGVLSYPSHSWKNFLCYGTLPSSFSRRVMEKTQYPFIDIPNKLFDFTKNCKDLILTLGFRFLPQHEDYIHKELHLPENKGSLYAVKKNFGLTLSRDSLTNKAKLKLEALASQGVNFFNEKILVEGITYHSGYYGRFLILVQLGVGCTVWYGFTPGEEFIVPVNTLLFNEIESYEPFVNNPATHVQPGFDKMTLHENEDNIIPKVASTYFKEKPFVDIEIPATGSTIVCVGLGLVIIVLLTMGISPDVGMDAE